MKSIRSTSILFAKLYTLWFLIWLNAEALKMERSWTYELKSVESTSTDPDLLEVNLRIERVGRGIHALSGHYKLNYDIVEGDNNEVDVAIYRSKNGVEPYRPTPFKAYRTHVFKFFNSFYKETVMKTFKDCSDLPAFEDQFMPPFEKKTYTLNQCQITMEGGPQYLQEGFYKAVMSGYGAVEWSITVIAQVETNV